MGSIRIMAAVLVALTFAATQPDVYAQARKTESRTATRTTRQSSGSSSNVRKSTPEKKSTSVRQAAPARQSKPSGQSMTDRRQSVSRPAIVKKTEATRPSSATRPSTTVSRPSVQNKPATKPVQVTRPAPDRPSADKRPEDRPSVRPDAQGKGPDKGPGLKPDKGPKPPHVHPRDREFMRWDRPSYFWSRNDHFFGHRVRVLPSRAIRHIYGGITYYCYNDIWYRPYGGYYVVCRPPHGISLAASVIADMAWTAVRLSYYHNDSQLALDAYKLADDLGLIQSYAAADAEYFYQDGIFYAKDTSGEYRVIIPPAGAIVEALPEDYDIVILKDGNKYFKVEDTVYKLTIIEGHPYFEVLGQLYS